MVLLNCASRTLKQRNNPMAQIVGKHCADPKWPGETLGGMTHSTPCAPEDADSSGRHKWGVLEQHSRPETKDDSETRKTRPCWNGCDSSLPSHAHTCTHCMLRAKPPAHCVNVSCHWDGRGGRYVQIEMRSQMGKSAVQRFILAVYMVLVNNKCAHRTKNVPLMWVCTQKQTLAYISVKKTFQDNQRKTLWEQKRMFWDRFGKKMCYKGERQTNQAKKNGRYHSTIDNCLHYSVIIVYSVEIITF